MFTDVLKPFYWSGKNKLLPRKGIPWKAIGITLFSLALCAFLYGTTLKVVGYFHKQNELGVILSLKIFQMAWLTLFAMLIFSCMVSAVSAIFLSQDNEIVFSSPLPHQKLYFMRFTTTFFYTSWMMILFSFPVFSAFGQVFSAGQLFWPFLICATFSTALTAVGFSLALTIILVNIFPARRTKDIVFYLSLCFALFIYAMFRLMRPEELANPEKFAHFVDYLSSISGPAGPYVPGGWAADFLITYLLDREVDWLLAGLLLTTPPSLYFLGEAIMGKLFFSGYTKAQESFGGYRRFKTSKVRISSPLRWIMRKEAKTFLRDSTEWSQLFMIGALVAVYLYNFKVLPLDRSFWKEEYLTNLISFLNIGLITFVITSLSARFVFPSIGAEGGSFFVIRASPLSMEKFLLQKYVCYCIPFSLLAFLLVITSDYLLKIDGPIWWISVLSSIVYTWAIVALALGFGAMYADFRAENRAAALGSLGAILFLLTTLALIGSTLALGASPAYHVTRKWLKGLPLTWSDYSAVGGWAFFSCSLFLFCAWISLKKGVRNINEIG
jgi:ABC-2 type transport system permease protein